MLRDCEVGQELVESALLHTNLGAVKCLVSIWGHRNLWAECETDKNWYWFSEKCRDWSSRNPLEENISVVFIPCSSWVPLLHLLLMESCVIIIKEFSEFILATLDWFLLKFSWFTHFHHLKFPVQQYKPGQSQNFHQVIDISILDWKRSSSANSQDCVSSTASWRWARMLLTVQRKAGLNLLFYEMMQYKDERRNSGARLLWSSSGPISINYLALHVFFLYLWTSIFLPFR